MADPLTERARAVLADAMRESGERYDPRDVLLVEHGAGDSIGVEADTAIAAMIHFATDHASEQTKALKEALAQSDSVSIRRGREVAVTFSTATLAAAALFNLLHALSQEPDA